MKKIEEAILDACVKMIDDEGVHSISVRKLVKASGCSLRSLYNKFGNLGAVYKSIVDEFTLDIANFVVPGDGGLVEDDEALHAVHASFVSYFLQHPNRFSFMYLYRHDGLGSESRLFNTEQFQARMRQSYEYLTNDGRLRARDVEALRSNILYGAFGLLTLYFTGNFGLSEEAVLSEFRSFFFAQISAFDR